MKRSLVSIAIIAFATFALSGCQFVVGLMFETELRIGDLELLDPDGALALVRFTVSNDGARVENMHFSVVLSDDAYVDSYDRVVYEGDFGIDFKDDEVIEIRRDTDMAEYGGGDEVPADYYYVGVILDMYNESAEDSISRMSLTRAYWGLSPDEFEPNDSFAEGEFRTLDSNMWHYANFHVGGDEDWFAVHQQGDHSLTIETSPGPSGMAPDTIVEVYYSMDEYSWIYSSGPMQNNYIYIYPSMYAESYRVRVYSPSGETGEYQIYTSETYEMH